MKINYRSLLGGDPFTDDSCNVIMGYHSRSMNYKNVGSGTDSTHGGPQIHLGVEIEFDHFPNSESRYKAALEIYRAINTKSVHYIKIERDGSLQNGFEVISQPTTLRRHLKTIDWKKIFEIVERHGGRSHDGGTCGLHVHVPYAGASHSKAMFDLINNVYRQPLKVFSRRTNFRYCNFDSNDFSSRQTGHHVAYNTSTSTGVTTELRFFRGTTKYETFAESLKLTEKLYWLAYKLRFESDYSKAPNFKSLLTQYGKDQYDQRVARYI